MAQAAGVDPEQIEQMQEQLLAAREAEDLPDEVELWPELLPVFNSWLEHGPISTIRAQVGMGVVYEAENHAPLWVLPRLAWLDEEGVTDREQRRVIRRLWRALDVEELLISTERATAMTKKENEKKH